MTRLDAPGTTRMGAFLIATIAAFSIRLPFAMAPGFGVDGDAWLLASSARELAESGSWRPSRAPGYPLVELIFAALWPLGARALTVASALAAATAAGFAAASLMPAPSTSGRPRRLAAIFVPVALTALPCVAIPAASALDMPWALAALGAALLALTCGRTMPAAVLVGVSVLARPASAVVIPALYWHVARERGVRAGLGAVAVAGAIGATLWLAPTPPPLALSDRWPGLGQFAALATTEALGYGGLAALALAISGWALTRGGRSADPPGEDRAFPTRFAGGAAAAGWLLFAVFPYESNYLCATVFLAGVAAVPFIAPRVLLLSASVAVLGGLAVPSVDGLRAGPVRRDAWRRGAQVAHLAEQARRLQSLPPAAEVSAGHHAPTLRYFLRDAGPTIAVRISESRRRDLEATGRPVIDLQAP